MRIRTSWGIAISLLVVLCVMLGSSAFAFQDMNNNADRAKIESLQERGVISGYNTKFNPDAKLTYAEGLQLIVKALNLNIDHMRFIKMPLASDYYLNVSDNDAWYAHAFLMAQFHLQPPSDIQPNAIMTREEFSYYLFKGMMTKGEFAFIELYVMLNDEKLVTPSYMDAIQKLIISKVVQLDDKGNFRPDEAITRQEAAVMIYNALEFLSNVKPIEPIMDDVELIVEQVNADVNKVTVSWGEQPNPGYGITIDRIEFIDDTTASIVISKHYPDPERMYPQVITEAKAVTYVASQYETILQPNLDKSISSSAHNPDPNADPFATYEVGKSPQDVDPSELIAE